MIELLVKTRRGLYIHFDFTEAKILARVLFDYWIDGEPVRTLRVVSFLWTFFDPVVGQA
jgi:hypothetical protein